jgi:hypothetical protein
MANATSRVGVKKKPPERTPAAYFFERVEEA